MADNESRVTETEQRSRVIDLEQLRTAQATLKKYQDGKANLDNKIIANEDWWKLNHFRNFKTMQYEKGEDGKVHMINDHVIEKKQSAWLFNSIMNKHADAMDNFPEPAILPMARDDEKSAQTLSAIVPVVLDNCDFEQTYSDNWWDKLLNGCAIYAIGWNNDLHNGLGDIDIKAVDLLSFYYEPGVQDIQESKNIFVLSLVDNKVLESAYPQLKGKLQPNAIEEKRYNFDDSIDTTEKSVVVDWYYKVALEGRTVLQFVKYVGDEILYSSEDDADHPEYRQNGFYDHGKYPFVMDVLFKEKGTPCGFGYVDVMKSAQEYIDDMGADISENVKWNAKPRYFIKQDAGINQEEFQNLKQQMVHSGTSLDENHVKLIETKPLDGSILNFYNMRIDELKETSGNRDFSQGSTSAGVTSGSAIAALQEAGSKGSRDMIKGAYRSFANICEFVIELMRQFYTEERTFRITGPTGQTDYVEFSNSALQPKDVNIAGVDLKGVVPVFDIKVKAQKSSPYARLAQNELALQFYGKGFFNPEFCDQALATIDMMDFEGKDKVVQRIQQNGTMFQKMQQMQQTMMQMASLIAQTTGDTRIVEALMSQSNEQPVPKGGGGADLKVDAMGQPKTANTTMAEKARDNSQNAAGVK